ncbi:N-6 DNA methylase [Xanthomonas sp. LF07-6]|uniref:Eco57I restriction-modification methylase domain-containing protein n=1 Tax=Xanthomonas sp. LF07-6 TaxID=3097550 RepID=UPI002A7EAB4E|nr:N-6 DNA methylase [Xanthomonas sp. LF07-6]MDY4341017.1 N-6 DNA methylase [Xanthomonas sp. LF07-6]
MNYAVNFRSNSDGDEQQLAAPNRKRALGAYYTPFQVSQALCDWAIRSPAESILEPCFGGCTFLEASIQRMASLGALSPASNIYGCDIDPIAFRYLEERVPDLSRSAQFVLKDFLLLRPHDLGLDGVDAVVGNPPYVSLQKISLEARAAVANWEAHYSQIIARRASIWVHFTLHSLNFLKQGGRLAWVLPGSFLTAKYSYAARASLLSSFSKVAFVTLAERLFLEEGTEERTVIVLAEGYGAQTKTSSISVCLDELSELQKFVDSWEQMDWGQPIVSSSAGLVPSRSANLVASLSDNPCAKKLGDLADVEIGVVAGDTKFLIKNRAEWSALKINGAHLRYVVPQSRRLEGIVLTAKDKVQHEVDGARCQALHATVNARSEALKKYLNSYSAEARSKNATFIKRAVWHRFLDEKIPDAFFVFMTHMGPRLVLNNAKANATNALYRVKFKHGAKKYEKIIAIAIQTTLTQLAAELLGHYRGSGALKLEPSDVRRLPIFLPKVNDYDVNSVFARVDKLTREGAIDEARKCADAFIFADFKDVRKSLEAMQEDLIIARRRRVRTIGERKSDE